MSSVKELIDWSMDRPARPDPWLRTSLAVSKCALRVYNKATGVPGIQLAGKSLTEKAFDRLIDDIARDDEGLLTVLPRRTFDIKVDGLTIRGTVGLVWMGEEGPELVSNFRVTDLKILGPSDELETNIAADTLGSPKWSVCYINPSTGEISEFFGDTDDQKAQKDLAIFSDASYFIRHGISPPMPYSSRFEKECLSCQYRPSCGKTNA